MSRKNVPRHLATTVSTGTPLMTTKPTPSRSSSRQRAICVLNVGNGRSCAVSSMVGLPVAVACARPASISVSSRVDRW